MMGQLRSALAENSTLAEEDADASTAGSAAKPGASESDPTEARREAQMRANIRKAGKEFDRVAVVCGAWHVPALSGPLPKVSADNALLRGLPKTKVSVAWVPWTHSRLSYRSGYGAGVLSPGWYHHLFTTSEQPIITWLTKVAQVLRDRDLPVSSAHIIEATRLAETLAAMLNGMEMYPKTYKNFQELLDEIDAEIAAEEADDV
jgi:hypothetical protein